MVIARAFTPYFCLVRARSMIEREGFALAGEGPLGTFP
jgi:hypothetical protein